MYEKENVIISQYSEFIFFYPCMDAKEIKHQNLSLVLFILKPR